MTRTAHDSSPGSTLGNRDEPISGVLFDVKRFALHDGPGIRTTLFLKGCPLSCTWCHNPESQSPKPELMFSAAECSGCGACIDACPNDSLSLVDGISLMTRDQCTVCGACIEVCPTGARSLAGFTRSVGDMIDEIERDILFFDQSGGGVTLSGGEPLAQIGFVRELLGACKARSIHTVVDTCGYGDWDALESLIDSTDLFLYDIKMLDDDLHERLTGVTQDVILDNLRRLDAAGASLRVRYPVLPGLNDTSRDIDALAALIGSLEAVEAVHLLPYHRGAAAKWARLGKPDRSPSIEIDSEAVARSMAAQLGRKVSVSVHVGG